VNQQTAKILKLPSGKALEVTGEGYNGDGEIIEIGEKRGEVENLLKIASIANEASLERQNGNWQHSGDAMDVALLGLTYKGGLTPEEVIKNVQILKEVHTSRQTVTRLLFMSLKKRLSWQLRGLWKQYSLCALNQEMKTTEVSSKDSLQNLQLTLPMPKGRGFSGH